MVRPAPGPEQLRKRAGAGERRPSWLPCSAFPPPPFPDRSLSLAHRWMLPGLSPCAPVWPPKVISVSVVPCGARSAAIPWPPLRHVLSPRLGRALAPFSTMYGTSSGAAVHVRAFAKVYAVARARQSDVRGALAECLAFPSLDFGAVAPFAAFAPVSTSDPDPSLACESASESESEPDDEAELELSLELDSESDPELESESEELDEVDDEPSLSLLLEEEDDDVRRLRLAGFNMRSATPRLIRGKIQHRSIAGRGWRRQRVRLDAETGPHASRYWRRTAPWCRQPRPLHRPAQR